MAKTILPGQTIGVIGGGVNTRLFILEAQKMGYFVGLLTNQGEDPAIQVADWWIEESFANMEGLLELAEKSDVLVYLTNEIDLDFLASLRPYIEIPQLTETLTVTQDRLIEKVFLESLNINVAPYATITTVADIQEAVQSIGYPCVLKPIRVEVNQIKNIYLYSEEDFDKTTELLETGACILESWIPFEKELAVTLVVDAAQGSMPFPVVETLYQDGKVKRTIAPARIEPVMKDTIIEMGRLIADAMQMTGLLTVELYATSVGAIYVKRVSAQTQSVADFTLDTCTITQYEALVRAICGLPVPSITVEQDSTTYYLSVEKLEEAILVLPNNPEWKLRFHDRRQKRGQVTIYSHEEEDLFKES